MRTAVLSLGAFLAVVLVSSVSGANLVPEVPREFEVYAACATQELGASCHTTEGGSGTCLVVEGGPYGKAWPRLVCLNPAEVERGRQEGWLAAREAVPVGGLLSIGLAVLGLLAGAVAARLGGRRMPVDVMPGHS